MHYVIFAVFSMFFLVVLLLSLWTLIAPDNVRIDSRGRSCVIGGWPEDPQLLGGSQELFADVPLEILARTLHSARSYGGWRWGQKWVTIDGDTLEFTRVR